MARDEKERYDNPREERKEGKKSKAHPGFAGAVGQVERKSGVSHEAAQRIIGYGKAHASAAAKKANPHLKRHGGRGR